MAVSRCPRMDHLPHDVPSRRWIAAVVVACAVPLAVYCTAGGAAWCGRPFSGFYVAENRQLPSAGSFGWTGLQAGVPFHARVVTVDGTPVGTIEEIWARVEAVPIGTPLRYGFEKRGERVEIAVPTMRFGSRDYWETAGLFALQGWLALAAAAIVVFLQPTTRPSAVFFVAGVTFALFPLTATTLYRPLGTWVTALHFMTQAIFPATLVHLASTVPVERRWLAGRPGRVALLYVVAAALGAMSLAGFYGEPPDLRPPPVPDSAAAAAPEPPRPTAGGGWRPRRRLRRPDPAWRHSAGWHARARPGPRAAVRHRTGHCHSRGG